MIIAAGQGSRLAELSSETPKSMLRVGSQTLIEHVLTQLRQIDIDEAVVVTGYQSEKLRNHLGGGKDFGLKISFHHNTEWKKRNGISVLSARDIFSSDAEFLLLMSDHLFHHQIAERVLKVGIEKHQTVLAVDRRIDTVFDIDDATKVLVSGKAITKINKTLPLYNGIDCGIFKTTPYLFEILERAKKAGDCSLTDAGEILAREGGLLAEDSGDLEWIDVDTPLSFQYAERNLSRILGVESRGPC